MLGFVVGLHSSDHSEICTVTFYTSIVVHLCYTCMSLLAFSHLHLQYGNDFSFTCCESLGTRLYQATCVVNSLFKEAKVIHAENCKCIDKPLLIVKAAN